VSQQNSHFGRRPLLVLRCATAAAFVLTLPAMLHACHCCHYRCLQVHCGASLQGPQEPGCGAEHRWRCQLDSCRPYQVRTCCLLFVYNLRESVTQALLPMIADNAVCILVGLLSDSSTCFQTPEWSRRRKGVAIAGVAGLQIAACLFVADQHFCGCACWRCRFAVSWTRLAMTLQPPSNWPTVSAWRCVAGCCLCF
jgi:hypothetical protein